MGCTWIGPGVHFCVENEKLAIDILAYLDFTVDDSLHKK